MGAWTVGREWALAEEAEPRSRGEVEARARAADEEPPGGGAGAAPAPAPAGAGGGGGNGGNGGNGGDALKGALDKLTKWIPGDALALYVAAVTAFAAASDAEPSVVLLIVFIALTPLIVIGSTFAEQGGVPSKTLVPAGLACGAFAIWTLSVPFSGWQQIDFVNENQAAVAVIAAVVGLFFGFLADGITKALAKG